VADQASVNGGGPVINPGATATILSTPFTASKSEKIFVMGTVNAGPQAGTVTGITCWATVDGSAGGAQGTSAHTSLSYENMAWGDSFSVAAGNHTVATVCQVAGGGTAPWGTSGTGSLIAWGVG
jgi:hypothetical protein